MNQPDRFSSKSVRDRHLLRSHSGQIGIPRGYNQFARCTLENGLVLLNCQNDRLPLVSLNAFIIAGTDQNPLHAPGLAALTVRMLEEGTVRYTADNISHLVEDIGASLSTFCQHELSGISLHLRDQDLSAGLSLLAQMISQPTFPSERFSVEQEKVLNQLEALEDDPQVVVSNLLNKEIYAGTPLQFPTLGIPEITKQIRVEDLRRFHRFHYSPQNTILVIVGSANTTQIQEQAKQLLGNWHNQDHQRIPLATLQRQNSPLFQEKLMKDKEQTHICLGHLGVARDHPDFYALQIMDAILGNGPGFASRIPLELRDRKGLAYSTYSDLSGSSGLHPGKFQAYICTSPDNREAALQGLLKEIQVFVEKGPTEEELTLAKEYLTGSFVFDFQSNANVARFLLTSELFNLNPDFVKLYPEWIQRIDSEEVGRVARLHLDTVNYTTVIVGPDYVPR